MKANDNSGLINSLLWKLLERFGVFGIQFIIQLYLARMIEPNAYGAIAIMNVFIAISNVFIQSGFNTALIQKEDVDDQDYSSVLSLSLLIALVCYSLIFISAPILADFNGIDVLDYGLKILALNMFFGAFNSVQIAKLTREFKFKIMFKCSFISVIISGIIGIHFAKIGYGIWALIIQQLINQFLVNILMKLSLNWRIKFHLNIVRLRSMFKYSSKLLISNLIDTIYINLYNIVVGKIYSPTILGLYNRADQFPTLIVNNVNGAVQSVMFSSFSKNQKSKSKIINDMSKVISISTFIISPMVMGLAGCSNQLIKLLLTDVWLPCCPLLRLLCFYYVFLPIQAINLQAVNAIGRSDVFLRLEIVKKFIGVVLMILSVPFGIEMMILAKICLGIISLFFNMFATKKLLDHPIKLQISDFFKNILSSILMFIIVYAVGYNLNNFLSDFMILSIQISLGIFVYLLLSKYTKNENLNSVFIILKRFFYSFKSNKSNYGG